MFKRKRRERNKPSKITIKGNIVYIEVRLDGTKSIIDIDDLHLIEGIKWSYSKGYVRNSQRKGYTNIFLHRVIMGVNNPKIRVDHINGNPLDNRRKNLRTCNAAQNAWNQIKLKKNNTSGHTGVSFSKGKWQAYIWKYRKKYNLGTYAKIADAINARKKAEIKFYGEFIHKV